MPPLRRFARAFETEAELLGEINVGKLWDRMLGEFLGHYDAQRRQGVDGDALAREIQEFMDSLSDKPVQDQARQSASVAYNQGRSAELLSANATGAAQYVVRSEVLDENTCEPCARLDGTVVEVDSPDYQALMPPARCLGGDRCRGFYVPITGSAAA